MVTPNRRREREDATDPAAEQAKEQAVERPGKDDVHEQREPHQEGEVPAAPAAEHARKPPVSRATTTKPHAPGKRS